MLYLTWGVEMNKRGGRTNKERVSSLIGMGTELNTQGQEPVVHVSWRRQHAAAREVKESGRPVLGGGAPRRVKSKGD